MANTKQASSPTNQPHKKLGIVKRCVLTKGLYKLIVKPAPNTLNTKKVVVIAVLPYLTPYKNIVLSIDVTPNAALKLNPFFVYSDAPQHHQETVKIRIMPESITQAASTARKHEPSLLVDIRAADKSFARHRALSNVDFELKDNETTAIVGASGCGKSTLLQLVNGLLRPTRGTVKVFGEPLPYENLSKVRRRIGYAVQQVGLYPHLTVLKNVTLLAELDGWQPAAIQQRFGLLMDLLGLSTELAKRFPHELSGGQHQRIGLCRAMMLNPPLLLLDEPFSAVDPITRVAIHQEFLRLKSAEPRAIMLVTHDIGEAVKLADSLVIMRDGVIQQHDRVDSVLTMPANDYVEALLEQHLP